MNDLITSHVHLLLVEDNKNYLKQIIKWLTRFGYQHIDTAQSTAEFKEKLEQNHYDVIVTNMRREGDSGSSSTIMNEVKQRHITSVVIILTANDTVIDCRQAFKDGCWDYIPKNIKGNVFEVLHHSIQEAITYFNHWGNRKDSKWIEEHWMELLENYPNQYIAVINNTVIDSADTEELLKTRIRERKLPHFLPVIKKIEVLKMRTRERKLPSFLPVIGKIEETKTR